MAGYSDTPLVKKLGIKTGARVAVLGAPKHFLRTLGPLPAGVKVATQFKSARYDVILLFAIAQAKLTAGFAAAARQLEPDGGLWVAWPKRAAKVPTDVTENTVREVALAAGLVDNKVCAIDDTWSGLRCVVRLRDRPTRA